MIRLIGIAIILALAAGSVRAADLTVFAAASLKTALDEVAAAWEAKTGRKVAISYAGTSALARQIARGAPADVFLAASVDWMDRIEADGWIEPGSRFALLGNRIVLVAHGETEPAELASGFDLRGRLGDGRLAMALVKAVPAGIYGKAALVSLGLWEDVAGQVAQADNVRAALALVAAGEAPLGVVYATDAAAEPRVSVVGAFPEGSHPPIVYPAAAVEGGVPLSAEFLAFLRGPEVRAAFEGQGFEVLVP